MIDPTAFAIGCIIVLLIAVGVLAAGHHDDDNPRDLEAVRQAVREVQALEAEKRALEQRVAEHVCARCGERLDA